ncbi:hypothetical protein PoB_007443300 [Plakobranchus ocellatus]|uniref:Uncharacterized protein n=1 Tax=Plakobranchus ocellatus TaxID=259542 RepID=A0AAV4DUH0_9GAST|nr:hypothetical protein PoB_007443300 [Plakobranchus ocellatus]
MSCSDCQKRMHLSAEANNNQSSLCMDDAASTLSPETSMSSGFNSFHGIMSQTYRQQSQDGGKSYPLSDHEIMYILVFLIIGATDGGWRDREGNRTQRIISYVCACICVCVCVNRGKREEGQSSKRVNQRGSGEA